MDVRLKFSKCLSSYSNTAIYKAVFFHPRIWGCQFPRQKFHLFLIMFLDLPFCSHLFCLPGAKNTALIIDCHVFPLPSAPPQALALASELCPKPWEVGLKELWPLLSCLWLLVGCTYGGAPAGDWREVSQVFILLTPSCRVFLIDLCPRTECHQSSQAGHFIQPSLLGSATYSLLLLFGSSAG